MPLVAPELRAEAARLPGLLVGACAVAEQQRQREEEQRRRQRDQRHLHQPPTARAWPAVAKPRIGAAPERAEQPARRAERRVEQQLEQRGHVPPRVQLPHRDRLEREKPEVGHARLDPVLPRAEEHERDRGDRRRSERAPHELLRPEGAALLQAVEHAPDRRAERGRKARGRADGDEVAPVDVVTEVADPRPRERKGARGAALAEGPAQPQVLAPARESRAHDGANVDKRSLRPDREE
mmetsp:Transcript_31390/g.78502  ORF Transcript_31390/g.78502 Transcript_31390/m.78502 type:complete len:238 (+) Transcript_31390:732-1445(+)